MAQKTKIANTKKTNTQKSAQKTAQKTPEAPEVEVSAKEMAQPEPRRVHTGQTPSSFRSGKTLTPLRHDYRCGAMSALDNKFLRDCITFAGTGNTFPRLNADAGRLGRLYTLNFVEYDETGVYDEDQIVTLLPKAREFTAKVTATPAEKKKSA